MEQNINVLIVKSENCNECKDLITKLEILRIILNNFKLNICDVNVFNQNELNIFKVFITPALFINGNLVNYGALPLNKLKELINKYYNKNIIKLFKN